jgi:phosphonate transport system ATP-binding protein
MNSSGDSGLAFVLDDVNKVYPEKVALAPLSLTIARGERIALVGPSGAGKTTLLHLLGGITQPNQGRIWIHGQPLASFNPGRKLSSLVGIIHQQFDLVPSLAVVHNVLAGRLGQWGFARSLVSLISPRERTRAIEALEKVGIADKVNERTIRLSGGEQQRVAVARLLVQDPRIILADEPVASLDPARAQDLLSLLCDITTQRGETIVASLHVVDLVRRYFSRVIGLRNGELQFDIPSCELTEEILEQLYEIKAVVECADVH